MAEADRLLIDLIEHGREERNLEYKGASEGQGFAWGVAAVNAKIARTAIAMANIGGGAIVIGMDKDGPDRWSPKGVSEEVDLSYQQDEVLQYVNERAQPPVHLSVYHLAHRDTRFVVIQVAGFTDLPVVCSKGVGKDLRRSAMYVRRQDEEPLEQDQDGELRDGALYSRSMVKYETAEVRGQSEMREILNRAIDAGIRRQLAPFEPFLEAMRAWMGGISPAESDEQRFEEQRDRP